MTETTTLRGALIMPYPSALGPADEPLTIEWPEGHSYAVVATALHGGAVLGTTYRLALRQRQGLMGSIGTLMGLDIRVPDYSTLSRRANGLSIAQAMRQAGSVAVHLVVDSTGLKIFGEGEWLAQKHKIKGIRRRWRKLHLGLDLASGAIVCADLTHDEVGDSTASGSWINSMLLSRAFWLTAPMMERLYGIC